MKLKLLAIAIACSASSMQAQQRWAVGIDYTASRTNIRVPDSPEFSELTPVNRRSGGVSVHWRASGRISLESGVTMGTLGTRWTEATTLRNLENRIGVLQVPLLANVRIGRVGKIRVDATAGAGLNRHAVGQVIDRNLNGLLGEYRTRAFSASALMGAQVVYESRFPLRLAIRHSRGLTSVHKNESTRPISTSAMLGVSVLRW